jgi:retron-type reverse transcriptase
LNSIIKEQKIIDEIRKLFKYKAISFIIKKNNYTNNLGTPQNSPILPFLFNIYMSRLDTYIENYIKQNQKGIWKTNPE